MINIFPKTPSELRSKFQIMPRVLKLVFFDSEIGLHFG